ncbi:hypothetical protein HAX54_032971, partial [Datura stramonium]|nr:hypothetical protein [Datura stramonium]
EREEKEERRAEGGRCDGIVGAAAVHGGLFLVKMRGTKKGQGCVTVEVEKRERERQWSAGAATAVARRLRERREEATGFFVKEKMRESFRVW